MWTVQDMVMSALGDLAWPAAVVASVAIVTSKLGRKHD